MIDNRLTFSEHLTYVGGKCSMTAYALVRIMPNLGGPKREKTATDEGSEIDIYMQPLCGPRLWRRGPIEQE